MTSQTEDLTVAAVRAAGRTLLRVAGAAVLAAGAGFAGAAPVSAQSAEAEISISGTSTVRNWTCEVQAPVEIDRGSGPAAPGFPEGVSSATVTVRVTEIECPEEEMEDHLQEAMRVDEFPEIVYRLDGYTVSEGGRATLTGTMTILDATREVEFAAALEPEGEGVRVSGETRLDMTEYGVEPPTVMLGMLRVGPEITLDFATVVPRASR